MTKFQHKIYQFSLTLMELVPLPDSEETFIEAYSTPLIQWRYLLGPSLRAETIFPLDALKILDSTAYDEAADQITMVLLKEIIEIQRIFFLIIAEQNEGLIAFTEVVLKHWMGMLKEMRDAGLSPEVLFMAGKSFDALLNLHFDAEIDSMMGAVSLYPFEKLYADGSADQLEADFDQLRELLKSEED